MRTVMFLGVSGLLAFAAAACSATNGSNVFGGGGGTTSGNASSGTSQGGSTGNGNGGDIGFDGGPSGTGGGGVSTCDATADEDKDGDGFSITQGDCNDCDPNVSPNAVEVIATDGSGGGGAAPPAVDEDCDGTVDNIPQPCDGALDVASMDPFDGARAVELCKKVEAPGEWGVVEAKWVKPDGQPFASPTFDLGHGMLSGFGPNVNVQMGGRMLGLSSGSARQPTDPGYQNVSGYDKGYTSGSPQGFPKESPACPGVITGTPHDGTGLELKIHTPANAQGFSFDFNFFTYEWPGYVCSQYNDFFVAELTPWPQGQNDGNISFDSQGNPVSVNNAFLEVCGCAGGPPCSAGGKTFTCSLGNQSLIGNGFGADQAFGQDHGSTYWLVTKAPVQPNTDIVIRWSVYDSGDGVLDTTTLIDNWQWIATPGTAVGTDPVPDPS